MLSVAMNNIKNLNVQQKILDILKENNIRCAILKGISVSMYYPEPLHRPLGDIDILVDEENYDKAIDLLTGSTDRDLEHYEHKFHYHFTFEGITIEIHKFMTEYSDDKYGEFLKEHLKSALDSIEIKQYKCYNFPVLSPEYQIISLLLHTQRHFFEHRTNLRMICDYAMYVQNLSLKEWSSLCPSLEKLKLNIFANALILMCKKYLNISIDYEIKSDIEEEIIDSLMEEFLYIRVDTDYTKNIQKKRVVEIVCAVLRTVHQAAKRDFKILERLPVLYPVYWLFVPLRTIWRRLTGQKKDFLVFEYGVSMDQRRKLCDYLNLNN